LDDDPQAIGGKRILLGRILAAHGIRGDVIVRTFTKEPGGIAAYGPLSDAQGARLFSLKPIRMTPKGLIAHIRGIDDRTAAEQLKGTELYAERSQLPEPEDGEFYFEDLVGLAVCDPDGRRIGVVIGVHNFGAGDILEVRIEGRSRTDLVPFADPFVPEVDIPGRRVVVDMPPEEPKSKPKRKEHDA
jgi:16S rRNA processing protein RimM